ncbi:MAG: TetR/AcrR family transcriptional regulator [Algoriphagus sp.]|uniref:TetR/AcrR family transcriptional regulator n=1 Tax=Algoriphagus sp. TaxID=1872435 RepID=UPI0027221FB0|nr:TetR/AcrR family transcriptional regulator [Algoriphagus sp.]MDO8967408.1 TetR/AcrR family transcriptional regulator [Algoriphagus sp.]MDP2043333.1 TetR/AcrR family transcriptional regulator [Algoriphagus sp.]MDP3198337.1 TetR/AcrR family transcriptional regulator [Algoriphagus sp.]MDP3472270.1 TetR/AcrR family transcriptional regulator [Algoriphagus sp.]
METRKRILEIATEQFARYGVRAVTMEDIARQAGVSKKTIYQEFSDKKDLVKEAFEKILDEDRCKLAFILETEDGVIEHLVKTSKMMRERLQNMNPMVILEIQKYFPEAWRMFEAFKVEVIMKDLVKVIEKGKELGYFRAEIDSEILAKTRVNQITSSFDPSNFSNPNHNLADEQMVLLDHFLHGIFTEKGRIAFTTQQAIED